MFAIKNNKRHVMYVDDEPPDKNLISDGDLLIKELYKKQNNKKVDLTEQLQNTKGFEKSTEFVPLTSYTAGSSTLQDFQTIIQHSNEIETLNSVGLAPDDIKLYLDSKHGDHYLSEIHPNYENTLLQERLKDIREKITDYCKQQDTAVEKHSSVGRHKSKFALAVKPDSAETRLLQFALENERQNEQALPHPMDTIKQLAEERFGKALNAEVLSVSKIRKKARNLANKIRKIGKSVEDNCPGKSTGETSFCSHSKWDLKEDVPCSAPPSKIVKHYTCKPQKLYTIKDGEIVEVNSSGHLVNDQKITTKRMSIDEIKQDPKFKNYEEGEPSKVLYVKNLHRKVTANDLKGLILQYTQEDFDVKILTGKMSGQAFLTFQTVDAAAKVLPLIIGIILNNRPIVATFGKKKT